MGIGKFNVKLGFFAVLGYLLVLIGAGQSLIILAGFLIIAEKSRKANTQIVQAVVLYVLNSIVVMAIDRIMMGTANMLNSFGMYGAAMGVTEAVIKVNGFVGGVVGLVAVAGIVFILIGKPVEFPFVDKIFGDAEDKKVPTVEEYVHI